MEIRSFAADAGPKLTGRTIEGYGAVFNHESRILYDKERKRAFVEVIEKGAITEELLRSCDVKALIEHNKQRLLARSNKGEGSLQLLVTDYGMAYRFDAPDTSEGNTAMVMIERRDFFGSSFAFYTDEKKNVTYEMRNGMLYRTVHKIDLITDISIVSDPAYFGTDVAIRSMDAIEESLTIVDESYKEKINNLRKFI